LIEERTVSDNSLIEQTEGPIATLTLNRPEKANAIPPDWPLRMLAFFRTVAHNSAVRCVLIQANGKHFMAGGDVAHHQDYDLSVPARAAALVQDEIEEYNQLIYAITELRVPVIAAVQGAAIGASVGLVAAADLVLAAEDAFFVVPHVKHGGSNDGLVTYFLPRQIGFKKALEVTLLARRIPAAEAARMGMVNFVVPSERLRAEANTLAEELSRGPTEAYALIKSSIHASMNNSMHQQARLETTNYAKIIMTEDWAEGSRAFVERRAPRFAGR
jgi:2-(1,2-epoxy-1,2-dihydrophenyl)acetyl-CoA isomerase